MALKRDLKAIFILDLYDILLQIATQQNKDVKREFEQSMNGSRDARRGSLTHNHSTRGFLKK
jgi:hypothetical protein